MNNKTNSNDHGTHQQREKKPNVKLKTNPSKNLSRECTKRSFKKEKSQKKNQPDETSKKLIELRSSYYDKEGLIKTKKASNDYYHDQALLRKNKKSSQSRHLKTHTSRGKNCSKDYGHQALLRSEDEISKSESVSDLNKIRIFDSKGVITFDGKLIKISPKVRNLPCRSSFAHNTQENQYGECEGDKNQKKKFKKNLSSRLLHKRSHKSKAKSKSREAKHGESQHKKIEKQVVTKYSHLSLHKKCPLEKQLQFIKAQTTRNLNVLGKKQTINLQQLKKQIQEELRKEQKRNLGKNYTKERMKCLKMISKLCGIMQFRKQSYSLAVILFDKYLGNLYVEILDLNKIALTCLILAVKHEEANRTRQFLFQILNLNAIIKEKELRRSISGGKRKKQDRSSGSKGKIGKVDKKNMKKQQVKFKRVEQIYQILIESFGKQQATIKKNELMQMENLILSSLGFKVTHRTYVEWTDAFTILWDKKIMAKKESEKLLFRGSKSYLNFYLILKILETTHYDPRVYHYKEIVLVLSSMYLLVRILMEGDVRSGFQSYKNILKKSSNSLFVDKAGSNQLFGEFLQDLDLQMGQILHCCQFVSQYMFPEFVTDYNIINVDNELILSIHVYNPGIYEYLAL